MNDYNLFICEYLGVDNVMEALANNEITEEQLNEAKEKYFNEQHI